MKFGIIGNGNIASYLLQMINIEKKVDGEITSVLGRDKVRGKQIENMYHIDFFTDFNDFIQSPIDTIIEVATVYAAQKYIKDILNNKKDIIVGSVGAFKSNDFISEASQLALKNNKNISLPSGAIGGLDLIQSANSLNGLKSVSITTIKPPQSLGLENIDKEETLFEGSAKEAIEFFPKNVNVALVLSYAGLGIDYTKTIVKTDPNLSNNMHIVNIKGTFGEMEIKIKNNPMPNNPKTSYLAALSIISTIKNIHNPVKIG